MLWNEIIELILMYMACSLNWFVNGMWKIVVNIVMWIEDDYSCNGDVSLNLLKIKCFLYEWMGLWLVILDEYLWMKIVKWETFMESVWIAL